jgi:LacI family transcriptional regulator
LSVGKLRVEGYKKALESAGIKLDEKLMFLCESTEDFDKQTQGFLDANKVDAVFALDEHTSGMAMKMGIKKGLKIPEEYSVIGFADGVWSRRMTPSLSTVSQHGPEIGAEATKMLIERLESKEETFNYRTSVIKTELRQRDSTRKL